MSASPRILSLDLGSQTLGLAEFQAQPNGGLVLTGYRRRDILADPAAETDRNRQISETLSAMMRELGIKNGPIDYAVSGQSVFARFVKLPFVDQDKIERIVTFEAQQNVPFPIEEVVWDYQLVGSARRTRSKSCWSRSRRTSSTGSMPRSRQPACRPGGWMWRRWRSTMRFVSITAN